MGNVDGVRVRVRGIRLMALCFFRLKLPSDTSGSNAGEKTSLRGCAVYILWGKDA